MTCHEGIEQVHTAIPADSCTVCHGGDPLATTLEGAHVAVPANWAEVYGSALPPSPVGFIKNMAPNQLDQLPVEYIRFVNPGDVRAVPQTCGVCHPNQAATMPNSVMSTNAGHYYPTLFLAGLQPDRLATVGSIPAFDPDCDPVAFPGSVCELTTLEPTTDADALTTIFLSGDREAIERVANEHYLAKNCNTCHQAGYPKNDSPGLYRSSGCASCHMVYDKLGIYTGDDPTISKGSPVHPSKHVLTTAIPSEQCATCHFQGGRIGLLYRGIREGGFSTRPENAEIIDETLYAHTPGYYLTDEDTTNSVDETPPDLHYEAGMECADCHVDVDVHGDGRIWSTSKQQVRVACEDCHGTLDRTIAPDDQGEFHTAKGSRLPQVQQDDAGFFLIGLVDGQRHDITQLAEYLASPDATAQAHLAMDRDGTGFSHTESLTCDTCHTSYNEQCIGCHVSADFRLGQIDYQTGTSSPGLTRGSRTFYSLDDLLLGLRGDGRIQTVMASQQVQMTVLGAEEYGVPDGELLMGGPTVDLSGATVTKGDFREAGGSVANNGFTPFFQHTSSRVPRPCSHCHPTDATPEEQTRVKGVLGYGTGEFMLPHPNGEPVDGMQFLDATGAPTTTWAHEGSGALTPEQQDAVLQTVVAP